MTNADAVHALEAANLNRADLAAKLGRTPQSVAASLARKGKPVSDAILQALRELVPVQHLNGHAAAPVASSMPFEVDASPDDELGEVEPMRDRRELLGEAVDRLVAMSLQDRTLAIPGELEGLRAAGVKITKAELERAIADERKQREKAGKAAKRERRRQEAAGNNVDAFAPLTEEERGEGEQAQEAGTFHVEPVPEHSPAPPGSPARRFEYRTALGELLGFVCRFETADGKKMRPLFWGREGDAEPGWCWRYPARPRPLFGLDFLAARPSDPVLVCEGEKAASAARELFGSTHVCLASPCGASAAHAADWSPLAGRDVVIWPDRDEAGKGYAEKVAGILHRTGAARVRVVEVPGSWPEGWDLSDQPLVGVTSDNIAAMLAAAPERRPPFVQQGAFRIAYQRHEDKELDQVLEVGVYRQVEKRDGESTFSEWQRIGSLLEVVAGTRDGGNAEWGRLLRIHDRDGKTHEWAMPMELMAGDGAEYRRELLRLGFEIAAGHPARAGLHDYLTIWRPPLAARCVDRCGWQGPAFVLPGRVIGVQPERVVLQTTRPAKLELRGTIEGFRGGTAALAIGNSRLIFAVSLGFAGPLLHLAGETSGGFTEVGASSTGKSTLLRVSSSVAGSTVLNWNATGNGLEAIAAGHNDLTLILDELGQALPVHLEAAAYMLGNGTGKARMQRTITARDSLTWRLALYASGEVGLAAKLGEAGKRPRAGQEVRLVDLAADAGAGLGVFEELHGHADGDTLARHLAAVTEEHRGVALVALLENLTADLEGSRAAVRDLQRCFVETVVPRGADGQVSRVARRMGLVAAAGEIATAYGITGWPQGAAREAVARRFREWLAARGGAGAAEDREALAQVRLFVEQHGASRFDNPWQNDGYRAGADNRVLNRAGFRRQAGEGDSKVFDYLVLPEVWKAEVCKGLKAARVATMLRDAGHLRSGEGKNLARNERIPGVGTTRVYVLRPSIIAAEEGV